MQEWPQQPQLPPQGLGLLWIRQVLVGLASGAALGAIVLGVIYLVREEPDDPCQGFCGDGTQCRDDRCYPILSGGETKSELSKETGKRKPTKAKRSDSTLPDVQESATTAAGIDDSAIPAFTAKPEVVDGSAATQWLSDAVVREHMRALDPAFETCVAQALVHAASDLPGGDAQIEFGIAASGQVTGVNATVPEIWREHGLRACVRKAVFAVRFPAFSGTDMRVTTSFRFD